VVQVIFRVEAVRHVGHFGDRIPVLAHDTAERFKSRFEENFGFLHFTTEPHPIRLHVILANRSSSENCAVEDPNCPKQTILRLQLEQPGLPPVAEESWVYLKLEDFFIPLGGVQEEVENLERVGFAKLDAGRIVTGLFSHIPLSLTARLLWEQASGPPPAKEQIAGLTVPLLALDLCLDQHTVLLLRSEFPGRFAVIKAELAVDALGGFVPPQNPPDNSWEAESGNLFGVPAADPPKDRSWDQWEALLQSEKSKIQVKGVFMHQYRRLDTGCAAAVPPTASGLGSGGGQ